MSDPTESTRRQLVNAINYDPGSREQLEQQHGKVWDTNQLQAEFEVQGFMAPFIVVREKATGKVGSLMFQHSPRFYFNWQPDQKG